jgi:ubiquinone/menaquinone biosynthesis C-methylase UbiE
MSNWSGVCRNLRGYKVDIVKFWDNEAEKKMFDDMSGVQLKFNPERLRKLLSYLLKYDFSGKRILEIGPRFGLLFYHIRDLYPKIDWHGIDISGYACEMAKKHLGLNIVNAPLLSIPHQDNSFDSVWMFDVLGHIPPDERYAAYDEIKRVMKPEGLLITNIYYAKNGDIVQAGYEWDFKSKEYGELLDYFKMISIEHHIYTVGSWTYQFNMAVKLHA